MVILISPFCEVSLVSIGNYTSIARGFIVGLGHPTNLLTASPVAWQPWIENRFFPGRTNYAYDRTYIGSDVWIGANVVILAGVTIGDGCFIGAGSIVTKDLPPFSVAVGNPCRVIRSRFSIEIIEKISHLRWFDYDWCSTLIDFSTPDVSLKMMQRAIDDGFDRRFEFFNYSSDSDSIRFERSPV